MFEHGLEVRGVFLDVAVDHLEPFLREILACRSRIGSALFSEDLYLYHPILHRNMPYPSLPQAPFPQLLLPAAAEIERVLGQPPCERVSGFDLQDQCRWGTTRRSMALPGFRQIPSVPEPSRRPEIAEKRSGTARRSLAKKGSPSDDMLPIRVSNSVAGRGRRSCSQGAARLKKTSTCSLERYKMQP